MSSIVDSRQQFDDHKYQRQPGGHYGALFGQTTKIGAGFDDALRDLHLRTPVDNKLYVTHDANGLLQAMTDRDGYTHNFYYDALGRLMRDQDPDCADIR